MFGWYLCRTKLLEDPNLLKLRSPDFSCPFSSEGREWGVGSVVIEFGVFGAPRFKAAPKKIKRKVRQKVRKTIYFLSPVGKF